MATITLTRDDDWFVITDEETGVTTQGQSKLEALLMLADALAAHEPSPVDLIEMAIDVFVPDPETHTFREQIEGELDPLDVVVDPSIEDRFAEVATEIMDTDDPSAATDALRERLAAHAHAGEPWLRHPLTPDQIVSIEEDRLRALAWDLDAVARAYNYTTDPTLPDLARADPAPWIASPERRRLELAAALLFDVHERLLDRIGADLDAAVDSDRGATR